MQQLGTPVIRELISLIFHHGHMLSTRPLSLADLKYHDDFPSLPPYLLRVPCG